MDASFIILLTHAGCDDDVAPSRPIIRGREKPTEVRQLCRLSFVGDPAGVIRSEINNNKIGDRSCLGSRIYDTYYDTVDN